MAATGIVARKVSLQRTPELFENVMKALIEAEYYVLAPSNRAQVIKTIMTKLRLSDSAPAEEAYNEVIKEFELKPYPSLEGMKNMQRLLQTQNPRLADSNPATLIDTSLIRKINVLLTFRSQVAAANGQFPTLTVSTSLAPRDLSFSNRYQ